MEKATLLGNVIRANFWIRLNNSNYVNLGGRGRRGVGINKCVSSSYF